MSVLFTKVEENVSSTNLKDATSGVRHSHFAITLTLMEVAFSSSFQACFGAKKPKD